MAPSNMSIQTGSDRPSMKQDDHPEHNMPTPEHDGEELQTMHDPMSPYMDDGSRGNSMIEARVKAQRSLKDK